MSSRVPPRFPADTTLELSPAEMERLARLALERIVAHVGSLPAQPAADTRGAAELSRALIEREPPETGAPAEELLDLLFDRAIPKSFNTASPGYLAYIPGGGLFQSAVADFIAAATNRYVGVFAAAPLLVQLETNVVRWFARLADFPETAGGFLSSGGSLANFSAIVAARRERLPEDFRSGVIYVSDQTHHCVAKAAVLAGFPPRNVREIASDGAFRLRPDLLTRAVAEDREKGLSPFLVVGSAGTVNTGAVDDLGALATFCRRESLWFHVDAAYGGFFLLTERGRRAMAGIEKADSIVLDPHKGLFLPYGTGCLLVRDAAVLRRAHAVEAEYLPGMQSDPDFVDFCEISPELSRGHRGLAVWLPLKLYGLGPFRRNLDEKLDLARWAAREIALLPGVEIVAEPQLSLLAFRFTRPGAAEPELEAWNRRILDAVNARGRVHLTATTTKGSTLLRICVLSFRTHADRMEAALEDIAAASREAAAG
ncbi:MAG TPA: pyridoxal-dependent decarboxylase [Thermoanaerobaculia bacterium]|nr:pyridoxal-dependent decarboxylase [Thermoanaerobaculia bacterium]